MTERTAAGPEPSGASGTPWSWGLIGAVVIVLWMAAFYAARLLEYAPAVSLWYPPAAVSFAAFMVMRVRAWPALMCANLAGAGVTFSEQPLDFDATQMAVGALMFAVAHGLAYWALAEAVLRSIPRKAAPSVARTVAAFLVGGIAATALAAALTAWVTAALGLSPQSHVASMILPLMIGDYAGLVALGPLATLALREAAGRLRVRCPHRLHAFDDLPRPPRSLGPFAVKLGLVLGTTALSLLLIAQLPDNEPLLFIVFVAIVLQMWIVHTQGTVESLVSIALFSLSMTALVHALSLGGHALTLQFAMITLAAGSYFGLAVPMLYADNAQLRRLLIHDALTGAYTRHFFVELSQQAIRQARARRRPVSMLMIDLDHLKLINDRHGHAAGDRALSQIVRTCQQSLTAEDLLGRLGGDEFCVLLPGHDHAAAAAAAQRMMRAVRNGAYPFSEEIRPSISVGIATTQGDLDDYEGLWMRADSALYVAKRRGRNQVAQEEPVA